MMEHPAGRANIYIGLLSLQDGKDDNDAKN